MKFLLGFTSVSLLFLCAFCVEKNNKNEISNSQKDFFLERTLPKETLRGIYKDFFPVGTAVLYKNLINQKQSQFIREQYSSITPAIEMKPNIIHPEKDYFDFSKADHFVDFVDKNDLMIRGHCLIWFYKMPKWFTRNFLGGLLSKEELYKNMETHITTIMKRYRGKVYCWDVVNEAITDKQDQDTFRFYDDLYKIAGEDYFEKAFRIAKKADPKAKLYYNDNFSNNPVKLIKAYKLIKKMKQKGVPIDGIGIQAHYDVYDDSAKELETAFKLFSSIGLDIQVTELDISIFDINKTPEDIQKLDINYNDFELIQAEKYKAIFDLCRKYKSCKGITMWGAADWHNYIDDKFKRKGYPYLFDDDMNPKKAFYDVINSVQKK